MAVKINGSFMQQSPDLALLTSTPIKSMDSDMLGRVCATPKLPRSLESHMAGKYMYSILYGRLSMSKDEKTLTRI